MKKRQNNSARASALQITISVALMSVSAILFASSFRAAPPAAPASPQTDAVAMSCSRRRRCQCGPDRLSKVDSSQHFLWARRRHRRPVVYLPSDIFKTSVPLPTLFIEPVAVTYVDPGLGYVSFEGDFTYDSAVVDFDPTPVQAAGITSAGWAVTGTIINSGPGTIKTLHVTGSGPTLTGTGNSLDTLFELRMVRVSSTPGDISPMAWLSGAG